MRRNFATFRVNHESRNTASGDAAGYPTHHKCDGYKPPLQKLIRFIRDIRGW